MQASGIDFDIAIIGAGPAGSAAANIAAPSGKKVLLLEAGEYPRQKVCGEFVSHESVNDVFYYLRSLPEAWPVLRAAPVINRLRLFFAGRGIECPTAPGGLSISRFDLDALLWQAARHAGAQAEASCEVRSIQGKGPFQLETSSGDVRAKTVIVAAGRWSRFTPRIPIPAGPKWIGLKAHYHEAKPPQSTDLYFFEHGYCGVQPVADHTVNACAMVRSDRAKTLNEVFMLHAGLAERARNWEAVGDPVSTSPLIFRAPQPVTGNVLFVGDAAAFIDPFCGDGISIALRTGRLAALSLGAFLSGTVTLESAVMNYEEQYHHQVVPLLNAASRIRVLFSWPRPMQRVVFEVLRAPGVLPYLIRRTRQFA